MDNYLFIDTETALIEDGILAPDLVCLSFMRGPTNGLLDKGKVKDFLFSALVDPSITIVGHNISFDFAVLAKFCPSLLPLIFKKYQAGLVLDTQLQEKLLDVGSGSLGFHPFTSKRKSYALGSLVSGLDKDTWRLRYSELIDVPVKDWPKGAQTYALEDARATQTLFIQQLRRNNGVFVTDLENQSRYDFAFQLMSVWGIRTDPLKVDLFEDALFRKWKGLEQILKKVSFVRENGTKDLKAIRSHIEAVIPHPEKTEKGSISTSAASLLKSQDPLLSSFVKFNEVQKLLTTYVPALKKGTQVPINASYNVVLKSGRTSCYSPNLQNLPRATGVRECFIPREGFVFCSCDYDSLELRTLAQVLYTKVGGKTLLNYYNKDPLFDPHTRLASQILGIAFEEGLSRKKGGDAELKKVRQMSKAANFGYAGGMGAKKFLEYALNSYGVHITLGEAQTLKNNWLAFIPEMRTYFDYISQISVGNRGVITQLVSNRKRGGVGFCDGANGFFQGLAADGAKHALWEVVLKCYNDPTSPLFGSRPSVFVHDEIILEVPTSLADEAASELSKIMCESMSLFCPDIPITASSSLMKCWLKDAEPCFDSNGKLIPFLSEKEAA